MKNTYDGIDYDSWVADLEQVEHWQRTPWIIKTLKSKDMLPVFGRYFFPHIIKGIYETPECHKDLIRELTNRKDSAIIFPRGHAKSTWEKIDTIHDIVYGLEPVILYVSASLGDAGFHFESIKVELENNDLLRRIYGDFVPSEKMLSRKWTNRHFKTTNGVNLVARGATKGRGVNINNARPTKIVIDDAETDEQVSNPKRRTKFHRWLYDVIFPSKDKARGFIKMVGTVLHDQAEVKKFYEAHGGIFRKAIEDGRPIWRQMYSLDDLTKLREKIGTRAFSKEYMNTPWDDSQARIKDEWITKNEFVSLPPAKYRAVIYIDPQAGKSNGADEYALTCLFTPHNSVHKYVEAQEAGRISQLEQAKAVVKMWLRYKAETDVVGVETVLNQTAVFQLLQEWKSGKLAFNSKGTIKGDPDWIDESDRNIPLMAWSPMMSTAATKDKVGRLQSLEPMFERGEIHTRTGMEELKTQLKFLGTTEIDHDDRADSLMGAIEISLRRHVPGGSGGLSDDGKKGYNKSITGHLLKTRF